MEYKEYKTKIIDIKKVTHNVLRVRIVKPLRYKFTPGEAVDVSIDKRGWEKEKRPFTFTCLPEKKYLEFTIKIYKKDKGVTDQIGKLKIGDNLLIGEPFGTIKYKGKGVFIAGGAGITPFIAIFRYLHSKGNARGNVLLFSNKREKDIILKDELKKILGEGFISNLTEEKKRGYHFGRIDVSYIQENIPDIKTNFYICGPDKMVEGIKKTLKKLGAKTNSIVFEK